MVCANFQKLHGCSKKRPEKYSAHRIMQILLDPNIHSSKIAKKRPLQAPFSSTFLVDLGQLSHPDDIKDIYGKWMYSGSHSDVFLCSLSSDGEVVVENAAVGVSGNNVYHLRRVHSVHPSNMEFRRVLALSFGKSMCHTVTKYKPLLQHCLKQFC